MKFIFFYSICFFYTLNLFSQSIEIREWSDKNQLAWQDFQGPVDQNSNYSANTVYTVGFNYKTQEKDGKRTYLFFIKNQMECSKSWVKKAAESPDLLKHEQVHFDIAEYFARELLIAFNKYIYTDNYQVEILSLVQDLAQKREIMQKVYDQQTNHSLNKTMQLKWEQYISELLSDHFNYEQAIAKQPVNK